MREVRLLDGRYYGSILRHGQIADLLLTETVYAPHSIIPNHSHASPYFCKILDGNYTETYEQLTRECDAQTLAFHPPDEMHSERFYTRSVRSFNVEITSAYMGRIKQHTEILNEPAEFHGGTMAWLATKMYREFISRDNISALSIEGLALEIVAAVCRSQHSSTARDPALWLLRARDLLHARFADHLTMAEIAQTVEVHPVQLARKFRRHYRCTIGEYLRGLRIEFACQQIVSGNCSLAEASIQAGFFDQSHFSRIFKTLTGLTPGEYRSMHRTRFGISCRDPQSQSRHKAGH